MGTKVKDKGEWKRKGEKVNVTLTLKVNVTLGVNTIRNFLKSIRMPLSIIKIARRNINNLRYADDKTLMAESKED